MIINDKIFNDSDTKLMLKVKQGDKNAYLTLYNRHFFDISLFFANFTNVIGYSEDLANEVFTSIWKNRESFRGDSTFKTYMYGIAKIILNKHLRKQYKNVEIFYNERVSNTKNELSEPEAAYSYKETLKHIEMNKSKLPPKQRQAMANCSNNTFLKRLSV